MSEFDARKFRFVSPGIFLNEIDQSQIPALPENEGPVIIGRAEKGPGMVPVTVRSFSEFVQIFGYPISGFGGQGDVWRDGNYSSPTYGAYAAQAYLRAGVGPITFIRLMGTESPDATDANGGLAGWETAKSIDSTLAANGGAYGLYVFPSASAASAAGTGSLAAVWYLENGAITLSGTIAGSATNTTSSAGTVIASDSNGNFKAEIYGLDSTVSASYRFSLNESSNNFVRKVFNTNPHLVNSTVTTATNLKNYWLGETFEGQVSRDGLGSGTNYGVILAVTTGSSAEHHDQQLPYRDAHSGWFFAQSLDSDSSTYQYEGQQKLFKFVGINGHGAWLQNNVKISITNIKASSNENVPHGTFDVVLRKANDTDLRPVVLERFSSCNLDPNSSDYIARKIGNTKVTWDNEEQRYRETGDFPSRSEYIRVVMHEDVEAGVSPEYLPFGVFGPPRYVGFDITSGSGPSTNTYAQGSNDVTFASANADELVHCSAEFATGAIVFPGVLTRTSCSADDGTDPTTNAYFGLQTTKHSASVVYDPGYVDYVRTLSRDAIGNGAWGDTFGQGGYGTGLEPQFRFSLDEVVITTGTSYNRATSFTNGITDAAYVSGSHAAGTALNSDTTVNYARVLESKINRFTSPLFGGSDGVDVKEKNPFGNHTLSSNPTEATRYEFYTLRRAIRTIADPEVISMNAAAIPGILNAEITKYLIDTCESRADALAIIDVKSGYTPREEDSGDAASRQGVLSTVIADHKARNLNSSYAACYYPWVKVRDDQSGNMVMMPPSVVALGVLANTERAADVWFAPAGFNRGGLSQGAGGLTVVGVEQKLTSRNRDDLYEININPIASFPSEGIVVFGQKTLQATPSALDRINVRRLMIFVKRGISRIASATLFQPNVTATWNDFKARADIFLGEVATRFGIDDFRVILDETTTTADLIDRNIMYAKVFIKPTRAIEFIAIDFVITRSGASFDD